MGKNCRENPVVVLPALPQLHAEKRGGNARGKQHPQQGSLLGRCRGLQMVLGVHLPMWLPGGHLLEPAAQRKTPLASGKA